MEEEKFLVLLDRGIKILNEEIYKIDKILPGEVAFKLYDTYGFPLDLTEDILKNKSLQIDHKKFQSLMKKSKELAKKNWKGSGDSSVDEIWFDIKDRLGATDFLGYATDKSEGVITLLLKNNKEVKKLDKDDEGIIITNQTPFYGESGGQVGDTGVILNENFKFQVTDVQKKLGDLFIHYGKVEKGSVKLNDSIELKIDVKRRNNIRAYHSATHLLHESLRRVLGKHVTQKGSLVDSERLRFDFSHMKAISLDEINKIEQYVNSMILNKSEVKTRIMTPKEAVNNGALAFFGEKYGEEVRVLSMGNEKNAYFSTELCGGTHVNNTGDIGKFKIISQSSIAAGVRRVEALRDRQLSEYIANKNKSDLDRMEKSTEEIDKLIDELVSRNQKVVKTESLTNEQQIKVLRKQLNDITLKLILDDKNLNIVEEHDINGIKIRLQKIYDYPTSHLRKVIDYGKKKIGSGVIISYAIQKNDDGSKKIGIAVGVTSDLIKKINAVDLVKVGSIALGGNGGGGRADFAQGGGTQEKKIDDSFKNIKKFN